MTIFADPPYELTDLNKVIESIFDKKLLSQEGVLILEHSKMKDFSEHSLKTKDAMEMSTLVFLNG